MERKAEIKRETKETDITLCLNLEGGPAKLETGVGFLDHMLASFSIHSGFGLEVKAEGDLRVDSHHTVEDIGIVLGMAFKQALGDKLGIERFSSAYIPMDEALAFAAVDISGRAYLKFDAEFPQQAIGNFDACLAEEFFRAFAFNAGITLHIRSEYGSNSHHICEAIFKACARALKEAVRVTGSSVSSSKGVL
ncbi:MAG: imidazoleglycerol-phosphate dehydratase HisB [Oscillospiraceae bacterium]|jgi:imidazoleglycerol-phosphate dehydratase|nr:imidazoleglycerol-phosphate dehydratase HisB [Oscillospiraceae bacterium]